jgi:hypothetical protein
MRRLRITGGAGVAIMLLCGTALADTVKLSAQMGPVVETAKNAKGSATLSLDTATKMVSWSIDYSGIAPPAMGAFMIPGAKPTDNPTPVMITLPSNAASPIKGSMQLADPQIAGIQSGVWWIMLGSKDGPELGGQVRKGP